MKNLLLPTFTVKNAKDLDKTFFENNSIKAVIFDIDNTLVCHTEMTPPQNVLDIFENLKNWGISYSIVSNNSVERVESFCKDLCVPYYAEALKPRGKYLKKVMREMGSDKSNTLLVGDQLFTDILGANLWGLKSVLVTAVGEDETSFVSFKRKFEKRILEKNKKSLIEYIPEK